MDQFVKLSEEFKTTLASALAEEKASETLKEATEGEDNGTFRVVASTEDVDRMGEVIQADAWQLEHFEKNPVILLGHDHHELPIGVATNTYVQDRQLIVEGKFAGHEKAQTVRQLYEQGVMRAVSVGFIPRKMQQNTITQAELLEVSFVSVPANPNALSTSQQLGYDVGELVSKGILSMRAAEPVEQDEPTSDSDDEPAAEGDEGEKADEKSPKCRRSDESKQDCKDRKIPELVDEGYDQDQAAAIADDMCSEACADKDSSDEHDTEQGDDEGEPSEGSSEPDEGKSIVINVEDSEQAEKLADALRAFVAPSEMKDAAANDAQRGASEFLTNRRVLQTVATAVSKALENYNEEARAHAQDYQ